MATPPTPRADPIRKYVRIARKKNPEMGANATHTASSAMEKAMARRPPIRAMICGAYNALMKAPVPHPALSQP